MLPADFLGPAISKQEINSRRGVNMQASDSRGAAVSWRDGHAAFDNYPDELRALSVRSNRARSQ